MEGGLFSNIKLIASDVDGVLTDSRKSYPMEGQILSKSFCDLDTLGIKIARYFGIHFVVVTGDNRINSNFARLHKIDFLHTFKSKYDSLKEYIETNGWDIKDKEICYLGNDLNDFDCIQKFFSVVPYKSTPEDISRYADCIFPDEPGFGFVRAVIDNILRDKGITIEDKFKALQDLNKWNEKS